MSGVYIKNMQMPENCLDCPFHDGQYGTCDIIGKTVCCDGRLHNCPLFPVPDHGRLVDVDALKKTEVPFWAVSTLLSRNSRIVLPIAIDKVATVIEADRSEK